MNLKKYVIGLSSDNSGLIKGLGEADKEISSFISKAGKLLGGLGLGAGFAKIIKDFTGIGSELKTFSDSMGIAVEDVSRLGLALEQFGGDTAEAAGALEGLQNSIRQAVDWGQGPLIDVMGRYGVAVQNTNGRIKTATELYYDLADVMRGLNKAQQRDLASSLGLDESSVRLLQQGREGVEELLATRADMAIMTEEDAETAREWEIALKDLKQIMTGFGRELARVTLPAIQKFADFGKKIAAEWQKHRNIVDHVAHVIKNNLVPAFAFAAVAIGSALKPLLLKMAPLTMLALLIDDIAVFMADNGGKSIIGKLLGNDGDKVRDTLKSIFGGLSGILTGILTGDFEEAFKKAKELWNEHIVPGAKQLGQYILDGIKNKMPEMEVTLNKLGVGLTEIGKEIWDDYVEFIASVYEKIPVIGSWLAEDTRKMGNKSIKNKDRLHAKDGGTLLLRQYGMDFVDYWKIMNDAQNGEPIPGVTGSTVNNAASNMNNVTVNQTFNGDTDPAVVKRAAKDGVKQGVSSAAPDLSPALAFSQGI